MSGETVEIHIKTLEGIDQEVQQLQDSLRFVFKQHSLKKYDESKGLIAPQTKNDPIRWDFSKKEIEKMMFLLNSIIISLEDTYRCKKLADGLKIVVSDWQRKIDYAIEKGLWK